MLRMNRLTKLGVKAGVFIGFPIALYVVLASQLSWRPRTLARQETFIRSVVFSPDGKTVASATDRGVIRLWSVRSGALQRVLSGHRQSVLSMVFSPDGGFLASGSSDSTVRVWDTRSGKVKHVLLLRSRTEPSTYVWLLDVSTDGKVLFVVDFNNRIQLWNTVSGKLIAKSPKLELRDDAGAFSSDKKLLIGRSDEGATIWSVPSGERQGAIGQMELSPGVAAMVFSPDGHHLATAGSDKTLRIWDVANRSLLRTLQNPAEVNLVAFSPDGQRLVSASGANGISTEVRIWDAQAGTLLRSISGRGIWSLALSADGTMLASGNYDGTITLWRIRWRQWWHNSFQPWRFQAQS
jgi:WD40 repeat protein